MEAWPRVVSPVAKLIELDGVVIALISVEVWPRQLVVRLAALPNDVTETLERVYEAAFEKWGTIRVSEGKEAAGVPPDEPAARLFRDLDVAVADDIGTAYMLRSSHYGGWGSEWHGDWFFVADVPEAARRITVQVQASTGADATLTLLV